MISTSEFVAVQRIMAIPEPADNPPPPPPPLLPVEIIFSCQVCHAPISEIYKTTESDKGFRDGSHEHANQADYPSERPVTRLWLTECAHLFCGSHLEGGGKLRVDVSFAAKILTASQAFPCTVLASDPRLLAPFAAFKRMTSGQRTCMEYEAGKRGSLTTVSQNTGSTPLP